MPLAIKKAINDKGITISRMNTIPILENRLSLLVFDITISP
jgi:hypothetical protein